MTSKSSDKPHFIIAAWRECWRATKPSGISRTDNRRFLVAALTAMMFASTPSYAEKRIALVIGNDNYVNLPKLQKGVSDAESVGDTLARIGFDVVRGKDMGRQGMIDKLADFTSRIDAGDIAVFFYAGHGVAIGGVNYLVPTDAPAANSETRVRGGSIQEGDVIAEIQAKGARVAMLVLDACRDNPFPKAGTRSVGNSRGLASTVPASGVFVLYSAGAGQTALDQLQKNDPNRNGVFTRVLIDYLAKPGLHLGDLAVEVRERVAVLAQQSRDDQGQISPHVQTPAYYDQTIGGRVYLAGLAPKTDAPVNRVAPVPPPDPAAQMWSAVQNSSSVAVFEDYIRQFGSTTYGSLARARLEELKKAQVAALPPAREPERPSTFPTPKEPEKPATDAGDRQKRQNWKDLLSRASKSHGVISSSVAGIYAMGDCRPDTMKLPEAGFLNVPTTHALGLRLVWSEGNRVYRVAPSLVFDKETFEPSALQLVQEKQINLKEWGLRFTSYRATNEKTSKFVEYLGFSGGRMVASDNNKNWIWGFGRCAGSVRDHERTMTEYMESYFKAKTAGMKPL